MMEFEITPEFAEQFVQYVEPKGEDCMEQPPVGIMTEPSENWRCPCSGDPVKTVGDVEGGDLVYFCEAECGWSYTP